ncbi:FliG C-terminal domain-containing protein [Roseibacterium sp. SDUM158017]|uniref:FliG C-terminal domain-containing protein n=1 Tax=Roseicyclus salinarum TaxID=3036773 RepID=UPI002414F1A0|nr:FliG C-terminal domain-containing protein [Roseibacterium sp. SDUM158017]MDG4648069.1 FliG C-terminal domain-containing protein [Roseibacterium sp. SDUM158017]
MGLLETFVTDDAVAQMTDVTPGALNRRQKAAVLVRLLLSQGVSPGLDKLTPSQQGTLARAMSGLGQIDRATLAGIVTEFIEQLDNLALTMPRGMHAALELLDPHISAMARDGLKAEAEIGDGTDPWLRLAGMESDSLRPVLDEESAEICAILLSKLTVAKAAKLLSGLPPHRAELIAHAVSLTDTVLPETIRRIGEQLHAQIVAEPKPAFKTAPVQRVGAILNAVNTTARDAVLAGLDARDADFAGRVRRAIFTFQHIPRRVQPTDVPRIAAAVDPADLGKALAAGMAKAPLAVEFLLENMSKRMAEQLRGEAEAMGAPREEAGEAAMQAVVASIRALEDSGEIRLQMEDGD